MLAPGTEVGRYIIKRKLAEGGMAEIFLASAQGPEGFSKDVVIKVVRSFLAKDSQFVQMFIAEARLVSRLNHANVVQIFDFGKHGESFYLAMEYVRGASLWDLRKRCREKGVPFPPTLAAEIGAQVARGLQYAHALTENGQRIGVVHRDVTPHNVLLSFDGAVKLTDFGIAKATTTQTAPGMLKGKFAYMSPEQSRGEKVDARTDIFALGIVLWEMLTGGRLFDGDSDLAVLRAVQDTLIPPPQRLNPDVPPDLSDVVMKALARPLAERFQTAFEMEKALANYVLRTAQSVDDSSVSLFLGQLYQEEIEAPPEAPPSPAETDDDDFGNGDTRFRPRPGTVTATPLPTLTSRKPSPPRRGALDDDDESAPVRTEEFTPAAGAPAAKPRTEQMPALKRPSRKFEPLPIGEPSVVVRPSLQLPDVSASSTVQVSEVQENGLSEPNTVPKSKTPMFAAAAVVVLGLVSVGGYLGTRPTEPSAPPPAVLVKTEPVAAVTPPPPVKEPIVESHPVVEVDAGEATADPEPVKPVPEKVSAPVAARKFGTITVKAVPFATVLVQGKAYEVTGVRKIPAPAGTYEITLSHPKRKVKEKVTVQPNETTAVSFSADGE